MTMSHLKAGEISIYVTDKGDILPADEESQERVKKMKPYQYYKIMLQAFRNYGFHKKYFAMLRLAYKNQEMFTDEKFFLDHILLKIGHVDTMVSKEGELLYRVKSISFSKCSPAKFENVYNKTLTFLMEYYGFDDAFSKELHKFH